MVIHGYKWLCMVIDRLSHLVTDGYEWTLL